MAEGGRFELPDPVKDHELATRCINHSANPPEDVDLQQLG